MKGNYVDGFLIPVPKNKLEEYTVLANKMCEVFKELGALEYVECISDNAKSGKVTSFPQAVQAKEDEQIIFSWIGYESKEQRDVIHDQFMKHPIIKEMDPSTVPFDGMRMIHGSFNVLINE